MEQLNPLPDTFFARVRYRFGHWLMGAYVPVIKQDTPGFRSVSHLPNDQDATQIWSQYRDALDAWRKNPIAKRIVDIYTDYIIGDGISPQVSPDAPPELEKFIEDWWHHPKNLMNDRIAQLSDELTRAGDLFITLHKTPDGMSFIRAIPKSQIIEINLAPNDWETELSYSEARDGMSESTTWLHPDNPDGGAEADRVMVHYHINRPVGASIGESDLGPVIPWLEKYSRMLEDRVRLNWAMKLILWVVRISGFSWSNSSEERKREIVDRFSPAQSGGLLVLGDGESIEPLVPKLNAADAGEDLKHVRRMIHAGSAPPTFFGEADEANRAGSAETREPQLRRLLRRQKSFINMLIDLIYHAARMRGIETKREHIVIPMQDINRDDNGALAMAARDLAQAFATAKELYAGESQVTPMVKRFISLILKFAGEPIDDSELDELLAVIGPANNEETEIE